MALEGRLRLDLSRKGKVVKRVEKKNTITSLFQNAILEGDFQYLGDRSKIVPESFFDGCLLTDKANNASLSIIAGDSEIIAQAGNDTYTGTNSKRGSYIPLESFHFSSPTDGFTKVWRWGNASGNGKINSVCLCPHELAIFDYIEGGKYPATSDGARTQDFNPPNKVLGYSEISGYNVESTFLSSIAHLTIVDYTNARGYYIRVSSDFLKVLIDEYEVSTSRVKLLSSPDYVVRQIGSTHTITLATALPSGLTRFGDYPFTVCYTGDTFHIVAYEGFTESGVEKVTIRDIAIPKADPTTYTETFKTFSDVWMYPFTAFGEPSGNIAMSKDGFIYNATDGYLYGLGKNGGTNGTPSMLRFDLNTLQVKAYDISFAPPERQGDANGYNQASSILLPNGDFYKFYIWKYQNNGAITGNNYSYYYHNDKVYAVAPLLGGPRRFTAMNEGKGTVFDTGFLYTLMTQLNVIHPYVSTVANLDEEVNKTYDTDMALTYTVREV